MWKVDVAEYAGDGYWRDYAPFEFDNEESALAFAAKLAGPMTKVRRIYAADEAKEE